MKPFECKRDRQRTNQAAKAKTLFVVVVQKPQKMAILSASRNRLPVNFRLFCTTALSPSSLSVSSANSKLRYENDPDKALAIFSSIDRSSSFNPISLGFALDQTVKRLLKSRRFADIETLIESQKMQIPSVSQESFISSLILSYGRAGMLDHAIRTYHQMDALSAPRTASSFNALLAACIRSKELGRVAELFSEIPQRYGIYPDGMSYGILIKSQCELGSPESAVETLKEMREKNAEMTTVAYTTVLNAFYEKGKIEDAEKIWDEMRGKGCSLDVAAYNVKFRHTYLKEPEEMLKLIEEMAAAGLKPDVISYNYLLSCYFANNQVEDAKRVYKSLWERGYRPNALTFKIVSHHLCQSGDFDAALKVFKSSVKRNQIPDFSTIRSLLMGLAKDSKVHSARVVLGMLRERSPASFSDAWNKLEAELGL